MLRWKPFSVDGFQFWVQGMAGDGEEKSLLFKSWWGRQMMVQRCRFLKQCLNVSSRTWTPPSYSFYIAEKLMIAMRFHNWPEETCMKLYSVYIVRRWHVKVHVDCDVGWRCHHLRRGLEGRFWAGICHENLETRWFRKTQKSCGPIWVFP